MSEIHGIVSDAGGGFVHVLVERDTAGYPKVGSKVTLTITEAPEEPGFAQTAQRFHERTQRCLEASHIVCAAIQDAHDAGEHSRCLPVEDGFTEAEVRSAQRYLDSDGYDGAFTDVNAWLHANRRDIEEHRPAKDYVARIHEAREKLDVTVARCKVSITMGHGDVQRCERPEDGRHERHQVKDYYGHPLIWLEDSPRTTLVSQQEVNWFPEADEHGFVPRRTPAEEAFFAPKPPPTLEERVEALERAVAYLHSQPSPYDVIGDQMSPGR